MQSEVPTANTHSRQTGEWDMLFRDRDAEEVGLTSAMMRSLEQTNLARSIRPRGVSRLSPQTGTLYTKE